MTGTTFTGAGVQFSNVRGMAFRNVRFDSQVASSNVVAISRSEDIVLSQVDVLSSPVTESALTMFQCVLEEFPGG